MNIKIVCANGRLKHLSGRKLWLYTAMSIDGFWPKKSSDANQTTLARPILTRSRSVRHLVLFKIKSSLKGTSFKTVGFDQRNKIDKSVRDITRTGFPTVFHRPMENTNRTMRQTRLRAYKIRQMFNCHSSFMKIHTSYVPRHTYDTWAENSWT